VRQKTSCTLNSKLPCVPYELFRFRTARSDVHCSLRPAALPYYLAPSGKLPGVWRPILSEPIDPALFSLHPMPELVSVQSMLLTPAAIPVVRLPTNLAGLPATIVSASTLFVTIDPAPITDACPISTPGPIKARAPIQHSPAMRIGALTNRNETSR
jgi:hypothetical protein